MASSPPPQLQPPSVHLTYQLTLTNPDGSPHPGGHPEPLPSHSWAGNVVTILFNHTQNESTLLFDRNQIQRLIPIGQNPWTADAPALDEDYGILLGSGARRTNVNDPDLSSPLGFPPLVYGPTLIEGLVTPGPFAAFPINRTAQVQSSTPLTVTEMGLFSSYGGWFFMLVYDYFPQPVVLESWVLATATYRFETEYPQT